MVFLFAPAAVLFFNRKLHTTHDHCYNVFMKYGYKQCIFFLADCAGTVLWNLMREYF